ncbi:MAG: hypothetical protein KJO46_05650, partial [Gammaproteobacteria bacterium]|nr:hypothetical protein [Gammaproteobacteria bacterium]
DFLCSLKSYIDSYYLESNKKLCTEYNLNIDYFLPAVQTGKDEILDAIRREQQYRSANMPAVINNYRNLAAIMALACLEISGDN